MATRKRRRADVERSGDDVLVVLERSAVAEVMAVLEAGRPVSAKIKVGDRRASTEVLDHLANEVARLGARFVDDLANEVTPT